ncbi:hypothetical protein PoB_000908100, partial [Plakobranchus ocellatus]
MSPSQRLNIFCIIRTGRNLDRTEVKKNGEKLEETQMAEKVDIKTSLKTLNSRAIHSRRQEGQHLHTLECRSVPRRLAVLDSSATSHTVAVTVPGCSGIHILEVGVNNMRVKRTLQTSRGYVAVTAVNNLTLAVGYYGGSGIDLIDLDGQVLRQI